MIFVRDKGRMCNNLLQYGHVYAWGREHGRRTMSMRFAYKYRYFHICHTRYHGFLMYVLAKYGAKWGLIPVADFGVDAPTDTMAQEERLKTHRHIVAEGWYARWYDLFLKYKEEIIALFAFDEAVKTVPDKLLSELPEGTQRLGVHIRRGDYQRWYGGRYYYSDEQYIKVIGRTLALMEPKGPVSLIICGNDPELDEMAFSKAFPKTNIIFAKGTPGEDLYLLSQCDRLTGAPSTFTLVAAMYRDLPLYWIEEPEKTVGEEDFRHFNELFKQIR